MSDIWRALSAGLGGSDLVGIGVAAVSQPTGTLDHATQLARAVACEGQGQSATVCQRAAPALVSACAELTQGPILREVLDARTYSAAQRQYEAELCEIRERHACREGLLQSRTAALQRRLVQFEARARGRRDAITLQCAALSESLLQAQRSGLERLDVLLSRCAAELQRHEATTREQLRLFEGDCVTRRRAHHLCKQQWQIFLERCAEDYNQAVAPRQLEREGGTEAERAEFEAIARDYGQLLAAHKAFAIGGGGARRHLHVQRIILPREQPRSGGSSRGAALFSLVSADTGMAAAAAAAAAATAVAAAATAAAVTATASAPRAQGGAQPAFSVKVLRVPPRPHLGDEAAADPLDTEREASHVVFAQRVLQLLFAPHTVGHTAATGGAAAVPTHWHRRQFPRGTRRLPCFAEDMQLSSHVLRWCTEQSAGADIHSTWLPLSSLPCNP